METPGPQHPGANVSENDRRSRYFFFAAFFLAAGFFAAFFFAAMLVYLLTLTWTQIRLWRVPMNCCEKSAARIFRRLCDGTRASNNTFRSF